MGGMVWGSILRNLEAGGRHPEASIRSRALRRYQVGFEDEEECVERVRII